jgi:hypothetical protein
MEAPRRGSDRRVGWGRCVGGCDGGSEYPTSRKRGRTLQMGRAVRRRRTEVGPEMPWRLLLPGPHAKSESNEGRLVCRVDGQVSFFFFELVPDISGP